MSAIWRELLTRLAKEIARPDPKARFRGSLVDNNMFAIDVNEWGLANLLEEERGRRLEQTGTISESSGAANGIAARRAS